MMKVVYKYPLDPSYPRLDIQGSILSAVEQKGDIVIYALIDKFEKYDNHVAYERAYEFAVLGTGQEIKDWKLDGFTFLNTVNISNGDLMFHVFYRELP